MPAQCPEYAKIGTLAIHSTSLPDSLHGALYLGQPLPGNRYRVFLVADGFGLHVKLAGTAHPDPITGQATTTFKDLPQFNFQEFDLHIFGAERGLLGHARALRHLPGQHQLHPLGLPLAAQTDLDPVLHDRLRPERHALPRRARPFNPSFSGGVADNAAGAHAPSRSTSPAPTATSSSPRLNVTTPPGFSATLKGIPYCPEAAIAQLQDPLYTGLAELASSACPAACQVGTVIGGAGAGSKPLYVDGKVYWAGPYKGAPLSLVIVIPAVSGPYDLGNVAVRVALYVDPTTAQVTAVSDPLPQILDGIPLRMRSIQRRPRPPELRPQPDQLRPLSR